MSVRIQVALTQNMLLIPDTKPSRGSGTLWVPAANSKCPHWNLLQRLSISQAERHRTELGNRDCQHGWLPSKPWVCRLAGHWIESSWLQWNKIAALALVFQLFWPWVWSASVQTKLNGWLLEPRGGNPCLIVLSWSVKHTTQAVPLPSFLGILQEHSRFYRQTLALHIHRPLCSQHGHVPPSFPRRNTKEGVPSRASASRSLAALSTFNCRWDLQKR